MQVNNCLSFQLTIILKYSGHTMMDFRIARQYKKGIGSIINVFDELKNIHVLNDFFQMLLMYVETTLICYDNI